MTFLVYKHTSPSGKSYIGQTNNIKRRNYAHQSLKSGCIAFVNAIKKYGWESFNHTILIEVNTLDEVNYWEEYYIKEFNTVVPNGYNIKLGGLNHTVMLETRQKISESNKGKKCSDEIKSRISNTLIGRKQPKWLVEKRKTTLLLNGPYKRTDLHRKQLSVRQKERIVSEETKQKLSISHTGKKLSEETKLKMSLNSTNKGKPRSDEIKQKISQTKRDNPVQLSLEQLKRRSDARKGKKLSQETIEKRTRTKRLNKERKRVMSAIQDVQELTKSPISAISEAAIRALALNQEFINGKLSIDEYNELLEDVVKLDRINKEMEAYETYRLIVKAYNTILTLKTLASLL